MTSLSGWLRLDGPCPDLRLFVQSGLVVVFALWIVWFVGQRLGSWCWPQWVEANGWPRWVEATDDRCPRWVEATDRSRRAAATPHPRWVEDRDVVLVGWASCWTALAVGC